MTTLKRPSLLIAAVLAAGFSLMAASPARAETLTVTITGVHAGGQILGALQTEDQFLKPAGTYGAMAPSTNGKVVLTFKDVKPGTYSLSVLQDDDSNKTMTLDAKGKPAEGWAMKNGAKMKAKPTWAEANFTISDKPMAFTEAMIYPKK